MRMGVVVTLRRFLALAIALSFIFPSFSTSNLVGGSAPNEDQEISPLVGDYTENVSLYHNITTLIQTDKYPNKVCLGDFNDDGLKDVAVIYYARAGVDIFYQQANHNFTLSPSKYIPTTGYVPTSMDVGDMNNDGRDDIVVCYATESSGKMVQFFQNVNIANNFKTNLTKDTTGNPRSLIIGNFDDDQFNDTAIASYLAAAPTGKSRTFLYHNNTGFSVDGFFISPFNSFTPSLVKVDFDGDEKNDILLADYSRRNVSAFRNVNNFDQFELFDWVNGSNPTGIELVYPSGTATPYLLLTAYNSSMGYSLATIYQWSAGKLGPWKQISGISGLSYATGLTLNGDVREDLVVASTGSANASFYYTPISGPFPETPNGRFPIMDKPFQLLNDDMDGDGDQDLIVCQNTSSLAGTITIFKAFNGEIGNANSNIWTSMGTDAMLAGEFTGTGSAIGYLNRTSGSIRLYEGGQWRSLNAPTTTERVVAAPLFSSTNSDIVLTSPTLGQVQVFRSGASFYTTGNPTFTLSSATLSSPMAIGVASIDGDGLMDILIGAQGGFTVYQSTGTGNGFTDVDTFTLELTGTDASWIAGGDLNVGYEVTNAKPSQTDVVIVNATSNHVQIFYQNPTGSMFTYSNRRAPLDPGTGQITWADVADLTGDGMVDIVVGKSNGEVIIFYQDYDVGFDDANKIVIPCQYGFGKAALLDWDDDGSLELMVTGSKTNALLILDTWMAGYRVEYVQTGGAGACVPCMGDANGDGLPDILLGSPGSKSISVFWQVDTPPTAGWSMQPTLWGADPSVPIEGTIVHLNATLSNDTVSDRSRLTFSWYVQYQGFSSWTQIGEATNSEIVDYAFTSNGSHRLRLEVVDPSGLNSSLTRTIRVSDAGPTAAFNIPSNEVEGSVVQFTDSSTYLIDPIVSWSWNFGDGTASNMAKNPTHAFSSNGLFTVTLTVRDADNNQSQAQHAIQISDASPGASFTYPNSGIKEGDIVIFNASGSTSPADGIIKYSWTFENGTTLVQGTSETAQYQFLHHGSFWVNLTVMEPDGDLAWNNQTVVVTDLTPSVTFEMSSSSIREGETVTFQPNVTASPFDPVNTYHWDFGDGQESSLESPSHMYERHGTFTIVLIVEDQDGSTATLSRNILVADISPSVGTLNTTSGSNSFNLNSNVTFQVEVTPGYETPRYLWTISTSAGQVVQTETTVPSYYFTFTQAGSYHILLRVNESDYQTETSMDIVITDRAPVAMITLSGVNLDELRAYFSANGSYDPDGDSGLLQFRWNFGDDSGWTDWSISNGYVSHQYAKPGRYQVIGMVRDLGNDVTSTLNLVLDKWPPVIELTDQRASGYVGDSILIPARITDDMGFQAFLLYSLNGVDFTEVAMTHADAKGNYTALIPAQGQVGTVWWKIRAVDDNGNAQETPLIQLVLQLKPDQTLLILGAVIALFVVVLLLLYFWATRPVVDEVFIIYHDGNLIAHNARRLKPGMDDHIMGSMLVALQHFVKDSFKDESETNLKRMDFGDKKIMVERGDFIFIAAVLNGSRTGPMPNRLQKVLENIDDKYGIELIGWDGDLEKVRGVKDETRPLFDRVRFLDRFDEKKNGKK